MADAHPVADGDGALVEAIYNRQRRHSATDMRTPVEYEARYWIAAQRLNSGVYPAGA